MTKDNNRSSNIGESKLKNLVEFEDHFKILNHHRLVREVKRIEAIQDKKFIDKYFDTYDKSVIEKDGE